ncbi:uncharacterized protein Dvar_04040 [Desulfosarcina variabilis str. Montpellier]|uniref:hypothetical protein n=1 Tax=Desulfosarcina variabilis TaxID=2300 RepID=UPI003AFA0623
MEKLTFEPLIGLLARKREACNRLFAAYSIRYPALDGEVVKTWVVKTIQPVMQSLGNDDASLAERTFDDLYETILDLAGAHRLQTWGWYYHPVLTMAALAGRSTGDRPETIIRAMAKAMTTILADDPEAAGRWLEAMQTALPLCTTADQLLNAGRLCAWKAGLAYLRRRALSALEALPPAVIRNVLRVASSEELVKALASHPWQLPGQQKAVGAPVLRYRAGGFRGFGGPFFRPPTVARVDEHFVATDGLSCCVVFADAFGVSVRRQAAVQPLDISRQAACDHRAMRREISDSGLLLPGFMDDIHSVAAGNHTLMLTRASSHFLYVYQCP